MTSDRVITCSGVRSVKIGSTNYVTDWVTEKLALGSREGQEILSSPQHSDCAAGAQPRGYR